MVTADASCFSTTILWWCDDLLTLHWGHQLQPRAAGFSSSSFVQITKIRNWLDFEQMLDWLPLMLVRRRALLLYWHSTAVYKRAKKRCQKGRLRPASGLYLMWLGLWAVKKTLEAMITASLISGGEKLAAILLYNLPKWSALRDPPRDGAPATAARSSYYQPSQISSKSCLPFGAHTHCAPHSYTQVQVFFLGMWDTCVK